MTLLENIGDRLLVMYDGHCGLCSRSIRWCLRRDRRDRLRFADSESMQVQQGQHVQDLLARVKLRAGLEAGLEVRPEDFSGTIIVVADVGGRSEAVFVRSEAALRILAELPSPWPAVAGLLRWIPRPVRDFGYRLIARWRYRIWGRLKSCPIPTPEERSRFL